MRNTKKRIAVIGIKGFPPFGGAARANSQTIKRLKNDFEFTLYTISTHHSPSHITSGFKIVNIKSLMIKRLNTFYYYIASALHCLFFSKYDLVILNHLYSGYIVPLLKIRYKVITVARGVIPKDDNKWNSIDKIFFNFFETLALKYSDHIVSVAKPHIVEFIKRTKKPISYIPNGAEVNTSYKKNDNSNGYLLFAAARIISLKGCHTFLKALNNIGYKEKIIIIGDYEQIAEYKKLLLELSEKLNVEFTGLIKDKDVLFNYINNAKLFVFPSFNEGLSNMLLEVASLKTPIIASDIIENTSVFNENEVLFFKVGNSDDLSEKLLWSIENYSIMNSKAENAYNRVITDYNWDKISLAYKELYENVLSGK